MNQNVTERMNAWIDEHAEEMIAELQSFVRIPSVSRADLAEENAPFGKDCRAMLDFALSRAREMGFETLDMDGYAGSASMGDTKNAIGIIGHLDVVPIGSGWIYPPYGATRTGDFLIGRGVSDNKNSCVMSLYLMRMYRELNLPLRHGLTAIWGLSEETGMQDMEYAVKKFDFPLISLVPDAGFPVCKAQKGSMNATVSIESGTDLFDLYAGEAVNIVPAEAEVCIRLPMSAVEEALSGMDAALYSVEEIAGGCKLTSHGRPAHAAAPEGGLNALHLLGEALCQLPLTDPASQRAAHGLFKITAGYYGECVSLQSEDEVSGKTTLNVGMARTRENRFLLFLDSRMSIAVQPEEMARRMSAEAKKLGFETEEVSTTQPFHLPDDHPAMNALMAAYREITGRDDSAYAMGGGTYSRVVPRAVTFGPGLPGSSRALEHLPAGHGGGHQCDEYMYIPSWLAAIKVYASAILKLDATMK